MKDKETDYMTRLSESIDKSKYYGIGPFRGKPRARHMKSKNAARIGIVCVRSVKYKPPGKLELKRWKEEWEKEKINSVAAYIKFNLEETETPTVEGGGNLPKLNLE